MDELEKRLLAKKIHGVHAAQTRGPRVDQLATNAWLRDGLLQGQTEAIIMAAQDGVIICGENPARGHQPAVQSVWEPRNRRPHLVQLQDLSMDALQREARPRALPTGKSCHKELGADAA